MKINYGTGQLEVPAAVEKVLKANRLSKEVVELSEFDKVLSDKKLSSNDKKTMLAFDEEISKATKSSTPAPTATETAKPEEKVETVKTEEAPAAPTEAPVAPTPAPAGTPNEAPGVSPSNVFGGGVVAKSEEQVAAERERRLQDALALKEKMKIGDSQIEKLRESRSQISNGDEVIESLRRILTVDNTILLFRTLVTADTRLKAVTSDTVKPANRRYHPTLEGQGQYTKKGAEIEIRYSDAQYKLNLVESAPSQPRGYFVFVPKALELIDLAKLNLGSNRQAVIRADESITNGEQIERVIRYFNKTEIMSLMILLNAQMRIWNKELDKFEDDSPRIYIKASIDSNTGTPKFSLRALTATNEGTKLSIRKFIPLATHDIETTNSAEFNPVDTTKALFGRLLFDQLEFAPITKFQQLRPEASQLFTENPDGTIVYSQFSNRFEVPAYESTASNKIMTTVPLPKVVEKRTVSNGNVRLVFSRSPHTEKSTYNPLYIPDLETVGGEINKNRRESVVSQEKTQRQTLALEQASLDILRGQEVNFK